MDVLHTRKRSKQLGKARTEGKEAMESKGINKKNSKTDSSFHAITFDSLAVLYTLYTPHAGESQICYKRKLAVYNFAIYEGSSKDGHCFEWGKREWKEEYRKRGLNIKQSSRWYTGVCYTAQMIIDI